MDIVKHVKHSNVFHKKKIYLWVFEPLGLRVVKIDWIYE